MEANAGIDNASNSKLYIPVSPSAHPALAPNPHGLDSDYMELEDSKHKVYIYDLDAELAGESDSESKPIFIPDIEKHLNNLPKVMLMSDKVREAAKNMQLVVYNVPSSLSVPADRDGVRKAILESRAKASLRLGMAVPEMATQDMKERRVSLDGGSEGSGKRYNLRERSKSISGGLQVPTMPVDHFASRATVNGYSNNGYDPDVMDMD